MRARCASSAPTTMLSVSSAVAPMNRSYRLSYMYGTRVTTHIEACTDEVRTKQLMVAAVCSGGLLNPEPTNLTTENIMSGSLTTALIGLKPSIWVVLFRSRS